MSQVETERASVSLEFTVRNREFPFVWVSKEGGRATMEQLIPRGNGQYDEFFSVRSVDPDRMLDRATAEASGRTLTRYDDGGLVKFTVGNVCPAVFLAEQGAVPRRVEGVDGDGYIDAEVPPGEDPEAIAEAFLGEYDTAELRSKRQNRRSAPLYTRRAVGNAMLDHLTDRQQEVLFAAVDAGYYEWPREVSGEELADRLDISAATLHEHLRRAESTLVTTLLDAPDNALGPG